MKKGAKKKTKATNKLNHHGEKKKLQILYKRKGEPTEAEETNR